MTLILFDAALFRTQCPAFANSTTYPDITIQAYWDTAISYISNSDYGCLSVATRTLAINLMTAHLMALAAIVATGQVPGLVNSATIDKISVTLTAPPVKDQWSWWLNLTPYGQQLLALLNVHSVGGFYVGGLPEIRAFRKAGGIF